MLNHVASRRLSPPEHGAWCWSSSHCSSPSLSHPVGQASHRQSATCSRGASRPMPPQNYSSQIPRCSESHADVHYCCTDPPERAAPFSEHIASHTQKAKIPPPHIPFLRAQGCRHHGWGQCIAHLFSCGRLAIAGHQDGTPRTLWLLLLSPPPISAVSAQPMPTEARAHVAAASRAPGCFSASTAARIRPTQCASYFPR